MLCLAYSPLLVRLGRWLWNRDHYSFFPLAIVGVIFLLSSALAEPGDIEASPVVRKFLIRVAMILLLIAILFVSPWISGVSAMFLLMGGIYTVGGPVGAKKSLPAWLLLWLLIPIPLSYDREMIVWLQGVATRFSSGILDVLRYRHVLEGVVIRVPNRIYQVEEACSGVQSLFSAVFCAGFYLILNRAGIFRSLLVLTSTVFWVLLANIGRIVSVVALKESFGLPVDTGLGHQLLGFVFFGLTMAAVFSTERWLSFLWPSAHLPYWQSESPKASAMKSSRAWKRKELSSFFPSKELFVTLSLFLVLASAQGLSIAMGGAMAGPSLESIRLLEEDHPVNMPKELAGWQQMHFEFIHRKGGDVNGEFSKLWIFQKDDFRVEASVDGPFTNGWHYLSDCYRGQGWQDGPADYTCYRDVGEESGGDFMSFDVSKQPEEFGVVVTELFDGKHRAFQAPQIEKFQRHSGRLNDLKQQILSLFSSGDQTVARSDSLSFQVQVFFHSNKRLSSAEREQIVEFFHLFRHQLLDAARE
ncbi:MAG: exosortase U [Planctomycetaceae bacterium]